MLSDAVLARAVGCDTKWLYNASSRSGRPLERTFGDAIWWRLVHVITQSMHVPLADAVAAATTLIALGPEAGRVRLRVSEDDTLALSVDLGRFHDGAAIALGAAVALTTPGKRGRPRKRRAAPVGADGLTASAVVDALRTPAGGVVRSLAATGVEPVVAGIPSTHPAGRRPRSMRVVVPFAGRGPAGICRALNGLRARPRGVPVRNQFGFDAGVVRAIGELAVVADEADVDLVGSIDGVGDHAQVRQEAEALTVDGHEYLIYGLARAPEAS